MNPGKQFEKDYKDSVPPRIWFYRFRDGTANWRDGDQSNTRFQQTNICDCQLFWDGMLALQELKSHKGKSLPHKEFMNSKGDIKHLRELEDAEDGHDGPHGIKAGVVINMRDVNETWYLRASDVLHHILFSERKSIPLEYMRDRGVRVFAELKRVHYRYDIKGLMDYLKYS